MLDFYLLEKESTQLIICYILIFEKKKKFHKLRGQNNIHTLKKKLKTQYSNLVFSIFKFWTCKFLIFNLKVSDSGFEYF